MVKRNKEKDKLWREQNKEKLSLYNKKWKEENKEKLLQYRLKNKDKILETSKNWQKNNKERASLHHVNYVRNRIKNDPDFKFKNVIRSLIKKSFSRADGKFIKKRKSEEILGCSLEYFKNYILLKCPKGTSLQDFHQFGYHIDHIIPISSAKSEDETIKLCHYTNFQPLWWKDNIIKSNKLFINVL